MKSKYVFWSLALPMILVLSGCGTDQTDDLVDDGNDVYNSSNSSTNIDASSVDDGSSSVVTEENINSVLDDDGQVQEVSEKLLVVDTNKCIGCGKCARTASAVFAMSGGKATVIQEMGDDFASSDVDRVIDACPVGAISWM